MQEKFLHINTCCVKYGAEEKDMNQSQYLRVFIAQLRKKSKMDPNRPVYIVTESGVGYRLTLQD